MDRLKAAVFCAWGVATTGVYTLAVFWPIVLLAPFSRTGRIPYRIGQFWSRLVLRTNRIRLEVAGLEKITGGRSYVFISNHASHLDPPAIAAAIGHPLRFIGKASLSRIPVFGLAARLAGVIFIDRKNPEKSVAALKQVTRVLKDGVSTLFFAEGTRSPDGRLLPFKKGGIMLALQTGLPIVPVTVTGSFQLFPRGQRFIRPGTVRVTIGDPVESTAFSIADRDRLLQRVQTSIQGCLDRCGPSPASPGSVRPNQSVPSTAHFS